MVTVVSLWKITVIKVLHGSEISDGNVTYDFWEKILCQLGNRSVLSVAAVIIL